MSKTVSGTRTTFLAGETLTDAWFCRIERTDGTTIGLTSHVEDITLNSVVYQSDAGFTPSAVTQRSDFQPGTVDVEGLIQSGIITRGDVAAGLYDNARIFVFCSDYKNPVVDEQKMLSGVWSNIELREDTFSAEFRSLSDYAGQTIGRTFTPSCDAALGDTRCQVTITAPTWAASTAYTVRGSGDAAEGDIVKPTTQNGAYFKCTTAGTSDSSEPSWDATIGNTTTDNTVVWTAIDPYEQTGTVTDVTDGRNFTSDSLPQPAEWWSYGKITFTSGLNNGLSMEVKTFSVNSPGGDIELFQPMPYTVSSGDTFTIQVGCRKRFDEDCIAKFDNALNYQGFPHIPTSNVASDFAVK